MILLNSAGGSAADPILRNLALELVLGASSMDIATLTDAWVDGNATFPGTNSIKSSLSPAATVLPQGTAGAYDDTTKAYSLGSTTGLAVGDYYYLSHASLTAGFYKIASIVNGTSVTIVGNPFNGTGNKTGVSYQVAWRYNGTAGTAPISSSAGGTQNYLKVRASDSFPNQTDFSDSFFVRDAPAGSAYIAIGSQSYTGGQVSTTTPGLNILSGWANRGGISHVQLTNHSVQTGQTDFRFGDGTTAEKTIAAALASGFSLIAGDGMKYGRILLKTRAGGTSSGVDLDVNLDTGGPDIALAIYGR